MKIMLINGPNLNMLGVREKGIYGVKSYEDICNFVKEEAEKRGHEITLFQSNCEGEIIDQLQKAYYEKYEGIIINPGAYTHYSYAIHDALESVETMPKVAIHISDISGREDFRKVSVTKAACDTQIYGHGLNGYLEAIDYVLANPKTV